MEASVDIDKMDEEAKQPLDTKDKCLQRLFVLFEKRVKAFSDLKR